MPDKQMCEMTHVTETAPIVGGYLLFWSSQDLTAVVDSGCQSLWKCQKDITDSPGAGECIQGYNFYLYVKVS